MVRRLLDFFEKSGTGNRGQRSAVLGRQRCIAFSTEIDCYHFRYFRHCQHFRHSQLPTPNSRFPTPDSRFPTPDSRFPTP
ncbi:MAG: hypothetical protein F6K26_13120 [Moorea sp. SIO2I5]|nr:hypothetical protein [Moorena sp. SIO2I5]